MSDSLYTRLGGYDAIAVFASALIGYLVNQTGGQMFHTGKSMSLAHQGMGVTEIDWRRFVALVAEVAGKLGVAQAEGSEVMAFLESLKADIVTA